MKELKISLTSSGLYPDTSFIKDWNNDLKNKYVYINTCYNFEFIGKLVDQYHYLIIKVLSKEQYPQKHYKMITTNYFDYGDSVYLIDNNEKRLIML